MTIPPEDQLTTQLARRTSLAAPSSAAWVLRVLDGPDAGKGVRIDDVATRRVLIGQSPACDVRLSDRSVSRRHAALESDLGGYGSSIWARVTVRGLDDSASATPT